MCSLAAVLTGEGEPATRWGWGRSGGSWVPMGPVTVRREARAWVSWTESKGEALGQAALAQRVLGRPDSVL